MINDFDLLTTCDISGFIKEEIRSIIIYKSDVNVDNVELMNEDELSAIE